VAHSPKLVGSPRRRRRHPPARWDDRRVAHLRRRWSQGVSARLIAAELGNRFTRTGVLAKIHRLGIGSTSPFGGGPGRRAQARRMVSIVEGAVARHAAAIRLLRPRAPLRWVIEAEAHVEDARLDRDIPRSQRRSLLELDARSCRWPVGDPARPGFFFCGAVSMPEKPYCAVHCARSYRSRQPMPRSGRRGMPAIGGGGG
jgi:GcrA cell cycle regulator